MTSRAEGLIESLPPWSRIPPDDATHRNQVITTMKELAQCDLDVVRAAIENYIQNKQRSKNGYSVDDMSRLFVLNRFIFDVPEKVPAGAQHYGAFSGVPANAEWVNDLWPLSFDANGELVLSGNFGGYFGDDYLALGEFDHFRETYGPRNRVV